MCRNDLIISVTVGALAFVACNKEVAAEGNPSTSPGPSARASAPATTKPTAVVSPVAQAKAPDPSNAPPAQAPEAMVRIPAGTFDMGRPQAISHGNPPVRTTVGAFYLDRLEVTVAQYLACVQAGKCQAPSDGKAGNAGKKPRLDHPINYVTFDQATAYCAAHGKRLPTEAEWEYAARGTDGRIYPWGSEPPTNQLCWDGIKRSGRKKTCAVGSYPNGASPFGILDMAGNVAEWTSSPETEAAGPGAFRVRGGSFDSESMAEPESYAIRADMPSSEGGKYAFAYVGFRCAN